MVSRLLRIGRAKNEVEILDVEDRMSKRLLSLPTNESH